MRGAPGVPRPQSRGPRPGSRPYALVNMMPGDRLFFEAHNGVSRLMQQICTDIRRNGLTGKIQQTHVLAIDTSSREVLDLVLVERIEF